jgi:hypothetical protein
MYYSVRCLTKSAEQAAFWREGRLGSRVTKAGGKGLTLEEQGECLTVLVASLSVGENYPLAYRQKKKKEEEDSKDFVTVNSTQQS